MIEQSPEALAEMAKKMKKMQLQLRLAAGRNQKKLKLMLLAEKRFPRMTELLPEEEHGEAEIVHRVVSEGEAHIMGLRALLNPADTTELFVRPGKYAQLFVGGQLMMSDTLHERWTTLPVLIHARGSVLVTGLGLGMMIAPLLKMKEVKSVTVIEKSQDVIFLVGLPLHHPKLEIICEDAFTWQPVYLGKIRERFDCIWHDIWPKISPSNLAGMTLLKRRYRRYLKPGGWQGCWCEAKCRNVRRADNYWKRKCA